MNVYFQNHAKGLEHSLHLVIYILSCETEFLIEYLIWSRETEAFKAEYLSVATYQTLQVDRKTCCKTENLRTVWKNLLLILLWLIAEQTL